MKRKRKTCAQQTNRNGKARILAENGLPSLSLNSTLCIFGLSTSSWVHGSILQELCVGQVQKSLEVGNKQVCRGHIKSFQRPLAHGTKSVSEPAEFPLGTRSANQSGTLPRNGHRAWNGSLVLFTWQLRYCWWKTIPHRWNGEKACVRGSIVHLNWFAGFLASTVSLALPYLDKKLYRVFAHLNWLYHKTENVTH